MGVVNRTMYAKYIYKGITQNGGRYTSIKTTVCKKDETREKGYRIEFYNVVVWDDVDIENGDGFTIKGVKDVDRRTYYKSTGKEFVDVSLFVDIGDIEITKRSNGEQPKQEDELFDFGF